MMSVWSKNVRHLKQQRQGAGGRHSEEKRRPAGVAREDDCARLGLGQRAVERQHMERKERASAKMKEEKRLAPTNQSEKQNEICSSLH
jgi:hypothetical protein